MKRPKAGSSAAKISLSPSASTSARVATADDLPVNGYQPEQPESERFSTPAPEPLLATASGHSDAEEAAMALENLATGRRQLRILVLGCAATPAEMKQA